MDNIVERISSLLSQNGMTAKELTQLLKISKTAVSEWKSGKLKPSTEALIGISQIFNVSLDWLLTGETHSENISVSGSITGNNNSNNIVSSNLGSVLVHNGQESPLSEEANKLIEIYNALDVKKRHRLLDLAFTLEDEMKENK